MTTSSSLSWSCVHAHEEYSHTKINSWVSFAFLYGYGTLLGWALQRITKQRVLKQEKFRFFLVQLIQSVTFAHAQQSMRSPSCPQAHCLVIRFHILGARACSNSLASPECCLWNLPFSFLKYSLGSVNATSKGYRRCMEWFVTPELVSLILPSLHEKKLQCNLFLF